MKFEKEIILTAESKKDPRIKAALREMFVDVIADCNKAPRDCNSGK